MKKLSLALLAAAVSGRRKDLKLSQADLAEKTGMNRSVLSRLESGDYTPSVDQLLALGATLGFNLEAVLADEEADEIVKDYQDIPRMKITVAGVGYVGLSLAVLLAQHNDVTAVDIVPDKVEKLNNYVSPIQDILNGSDPSPNQAR